MVVFAGCGGSGEKTGGNATEQPPPSIAGASTTQAVDDTTTSTSSTTTTTAPSTTTTTTVPTPKDPKASFESLAHVNGAIDYSKLSLSPCWTMGLIVQEDRIQLYQWNGNGWDDQSGLLGPDGEASPLTVTSADYTGDGVIDFLVRYVDSATGRQFGGIFASNQCLWGWADIATVSGDVVKVLDDLYYDKQTGTLRGTDFLSSGRGPVTLEYDRHSDYFASIPEGGTSGGGGSSGGGSGSSEPTVVSVECSIRATGLSSSFQGDQYIVQRIEHLSTGGFRVASSIYVYAFSPPTTC